MIFFYCEKNWDIDIALWVWLIFIALNYFLDNFVLRPGCEKMYYFTEFALALNDSDDSVAPTDSRRRPDQRLMENCKWDEANQEKQKLEEMQRIRRRKREAEASEAQAEGKVYEGYKPVWFENVVDEVTDTAVHVYKGGYWEAKERQDWSLCPEIY